MSQTRRSFSDSAEITSLATAERLRLARMVRERGARRALHAAEAQALRWHSLAEELAQVLGLVLGETGVRHAVPQATLDRADKALRRMERADGAEVSE